MFSNSPRLGYNSLVTLRFFRRKAPAAGTPHEEETAQKPVAENNPAASARGGGTRRGTRSSGRSGGGARTDKTAKARTETAASPKSGASSARASSSRGGRGRRGGAARKAGAKTVETPVPAEEPAPVTPLRPESSAMVDVFAQQQALLEDLTERQLTALKGLQGSLSAIENRLGDIDRLAPRPTERPRVGIFVDVPNVMYAAERLGVKIDFGKLLAFLVRGRELARASAYAPISDDPMARLESQRFVQPFVGLGYRIVTKPLKRYADGSMKANFDVELAIDVLSMSDRLDTVTLVSGDGDFRRLVELVASKGVRVEVVAFGQSTASELRAVADEYIDINDHLSELRVN